MTLAHNKLGSFRSCHHHFLIMDVLRDLIEPTPKPPTVLLVVALSHETQCIFFSPLDPPHKNRRLVYSNFSSTSIGATKRDKK